MSTFGRLGGSPDAGEFFLRISELDRKVHFALTSGEQVISVEISPQIAREVAISLLDAAKRVEDKQSLAVIPGGRCPNTGGRRSF